MHQGTFVDDAGDTPLVVVVAVVSIASLPYLSPIDD